MLHRPLSYIPTWDPPPPFNPKDSSAPPESVPESNTEDTPEDKPSKITCIGVVIVIATIIFVVALLI
jgi:hypothetical protein